jgi:glutamate-ammonia-ligase adenylyltransferase
VSSLTAFAQYQLHEAWTWEHQALVRARPIAGSQSLAQAFLKVRQQVLSQPREQKELRQQVVSMRNKMRQQLASKPSADGKVHEFHLKQDQGGIVDIEFMVQYTVLAHGQSQPELLTHTDNIRILEGLEAHGLMPAEQANNLREAYQLMRSVEHRLTLQNQAGKVSADELFEQRQTVKGIWQAMMVDSLDQ